MDMVNVIVFALFQTRSPDAEKFLWRSLIVTVQAQTLCICTSRSNFLLHLTWTWVSSNSWSSKITEYNVHPKAYLSWTSRCSVHFALFTIVIQCSAIWCGKCRQISWMVIGGWPTRQCLVFIGLMSSVQVPGSFSKLMMTVSTFHNGSLTICWGLKATGS